MTQTIKMTVFATAGFIAAALVMLSVPAFAKAADYAYVNAQGEVKSVTASDWMTAIAIAPNIHINSGVYLLKSALDFSHLLDANK